MAESLVTVRVTKELKEKMRRARINWSEELRKAIQTRLEAEQKLSAERELEAVLRSVRPGFSTLRSIKEDRGRD